MLLCDEIYSLLSILNPTSKAGTDFSLGMGVTRHGSVKWWCSSGGVACTELTHTIKINQFTNPTTFIQQKLLHFAALTPDLCPLMRTTCWARRSSVCWKNKATTFPERTLMTGWEVWIWEETRNQAAGLSHSPSRVLYFLPDALSLLQRSNSKGLRGCMAKIITSWIPCYKICVRCMDCMSQPYIRLIPLSVSLCLLSCREPLQAWWWSLQTQTRSVQWDACSKWQDKWACSTPWPSSLEHMAPMHRQ